MNISIDDYFVIFTLKILMLLSIILFILSVILSVYNISFAPISISSIIGFFKNIAPSILIMVLLYLAFYLAQYYLERFVPKEIQRSGTIRAAIISMPIWGTILILPCLGIFLYWVRSHYRLFYGLAEFLVGFITALNVFLPQKFDYSKIEPLAVLQVLGGLYIMVRGLDNVAQGIKGKPIEPAWKKIFGG